MVRHQTVAADRQPTPDELPPSDADHDCLDYLDEGRNDPMLPPFIIHHECLVCGEFWEHDTETGEYEVDR